MHPSTFRHIALRGHPSLSTVLRRTCNRRLSSTSTSSSTNPELYDIVTIGGGPAGLSLVNALRSNPSTSSLKIALIDTQSLSSSTQQQDQLASSSSNGYSNRCVSLTPASVSLFKDIGAWQYIKHSRIQPYNSMNVWDGITNSKINFDWAGAGIAASRGSLSPDDASEAQGTIAYMAENSNISSALYRRTQDLGSVEIFDSTKVQDIALGEDNGSWDLRSWPIVTLSSGQTLAARLLIGADGANSPVRTFAGIESHGWDYDRHGVVATVRLSSLNAYEDAKRGIRRDAGKTAYQRFLPSGPLALLPLPNGYASLVWSTLPKRAAVLKGLEKEDMAAMINAGFRLGMADLDYFHEIPYGQVDELEWRMKHTAFDHGLVPPMVEEVLDGSVASFPLKMRHADTYTGERVALVGDAAHTVHPLAGQGLNSGLLDVRALSEVIADAASVGADIGSTLSLEDYNARRYAQNHMLLGVCDKLHKAFSWSAGPVVWGRSLGFDAVNALAPVNQFFMRRAAGS